MKIFQKVALFFILTLEFWLFHPAHACKGLGTGGSAWRITVTGNITEISHPRYGKSPSLGGIVVQVEGTNIQAATDHFGIFKLRNITQPNITLIFQQDLHAAKLTLNPVARSQVLRLYDIKINGPEVQVGSTQTEDLWERWLFKEHEESRPQPQPK